MLTTAVLQQDMRVLQFNKSSNSTADYILAFNAFHFFCSPSRSPQHAAHHRKHGDLLPSATATGTSATATGTALPQATEFTKKPVINQ
jgi:hypothetical protein